MRKFTLIVIPFLYFSACEISQKSDASNQVPFETVAEKDPSKYYSFFNEELPGRNLAEDTRKKFEQHLKVAKTAYELNPDSLELIIWYGRRLAYLGKYHEAIDVYANGLQVFPNSYKLRRHRGHRYITTRQLSKAIEDFEMAAFYSLNYPDNIEPDGLPNRLNEPLSTDKFNIWYHYGLAHYLNGRYDKALSAYKRCVEFSQNNDLKVATSYWLYLTYLKLGNEELAVKTLKEIDTNMELVENDNYLDLIRLFKEEIEVEALTATAFPEGDNINATLGYGIGMWYQHKQNLAKANEIFLRMLESPAWDAFGYIAAEAELTATFPVPTS